MGAISFDQFIGKGNCSGFCALENLCVCVLIDLDEFTLKYNLISSQGFSKCVAMVRAFLCVGRLTHFIYHLLYLHFKTTAVRYYKGKAVQETKEVFHTYAAELSW